MSREMNANYSRESQGRFSNAPESPRKSSSSDLDYKPLYTFLNSVIFQYLDILGLRETICCFTKECEEEGYPIPGPAGGKLMCNNRNRDPHELRRRDVDELLKHFDEHDGPALLSKWKYIVDKSCKTAGCADAFRLNVQVHVFVCLTIPFRRNYPEDKRQNCIESLMDEFKARNHDDVNDPEILSLYALPFVTNPLQHPVFSKFFTESWIHNLRAQLKVYCHSLCKPLPDPLETDVAKMYRLWSNVQQVILELNLVNQSKNDTDILKTMRENAKALCHLPEDSVFKKFIDKIHQLREESETTAQRTEAIKEDYIQRIQLCDALVTCLRELYTNNEAKDLPTWERIMNTCSQIKIKQSQDTENERSNDSLPFPFENVTNPHVQPSPTPHQTPSMPNSGRNSNGSQPPIMGSTARLPNGRHYRHPWREDLGKIPHNLAYKDKGEAVRKSGKPHRSNQDHNKREPSIRQIKEPLPTLSRTKHMNCYMPGIGDCPWVATCPPPPVEYDNPETHSPRSLLNMMQASSVLRDIVRESANLNEER